MNLIQTTLGGRGAARLFALGALIALLAAAALSLAPAAADGHPDDLDLVLSLVDDSDNIVQAGSEIRVDAALRFSGQPPAWPTPYSYEQLNIPPAGSAASTLRINGVLDWEGSGARRLDVPAQAPLLSRLPAVAGASELLVKAFDGRTVIARAANAKLYVFDSYTLEHVETIDPPTGADILKQNGFGASVAYDGGEGHWTGKAIALWHETASRAWLFVGSWHDTVAGRNEMGRLYKFRLDWDDDGVTVTSEGSLEPTLAEADNSHQVPAEARYGAAVAISRDGSTLAVSAPVMNRIGAIYVYSRPDGAGRDWGDITYADGVKVSVGAIPSWGNNTSEMPFNPAAAGTCDAWCSMVWSSHATQSYVGVDLGTAYVALSADGQVLAVGAGEKEYAVTTPGGGFVAGNRRNNAGEAFVWVAPEGGWNNAPRADRDAGGNAKTLIAAKTNATSFRQATHYSPGPLRRVTDPAAILVPQAWPNRGAGFFGLEIAVSPDGSVIAVDDFNRSANGAVYLFQRDSADAWATLEGGYMTASAALTGVSTGARPDPYESPTVFNFDGSALVVGSTGHDSNRGSLLAFSRPADGAWVSAAAADAQRLLEPSDTRSVDARYGYAVPELQGARAVVATRESGRNYLTVGGCASRTLDGVATTTCPLTFPNGRIIIPQGTADGPFTIQGTVALRLTESGDPLVTLRDTLELTIGTVDELAEIKFGFATDPGDPGVSTDDRPYPGTIASGESTQLQLAILNENGKAAAAGSIRSVLFTAGGGRLSTSFGGGCTAASGSGAACALNVEALNASNSHQIPLTIAHSGSPGVVGVEVTVLGADGELLSTAPVDVVFSGPPATLAVAGSTGGGLLGVNAEAAENAESSGTDTDTRDQLTLSVTAADAAGNKVALPRGGRIASLSGPDGARVSSGVAIEWPLGGSDSPTRNAAGDEQVRIDVNRSPGSPLATGEYTLEIRAGALRATHKFIVSGPPANIALSEPEGELRLRGRFTISVSITDAGGAPVPDGTPVEWSATPVGVAATLVETASERRTTGGKASATYLIVAPGSTTLRVSAGAVAAATLIEVPDAPALPVRLLDLLAAPYTQGANTWFGATSIRASALLRQLPDADVVHIWQGNRWFRYSQAEGETGKESVDFTIHPNAVLWFGDDN